VSLYRDIVSLFYIAVAALRSAWRAQSDSAY
jgi:hypothetical protein